MRIRLIFTTALLLALAACATPVQETAVSPADAPKRTANLEGETITFYHFGDLSGSLRLHHHPVDSRL
jgi:ABC-type glycerol-3-phosphate transport system substrate-binding protein